MEQEKIERWRYPRFFSKEAAGAVVGETITLSGDDAKHVSGVLRMRENDIAVICDGNGTDYLCSLVSTGKECVFEITERDENNAEPDISVRLFMALPKSDKLDFIIQKATELGITDICPMLTKRCVSRPDKKEFSKKLERYNRIAYEAAKQCGRGRVPVVHELMSLSEALSISSEDNQRIFFYECGGKRLSDIVVPHRNLDFIIGSEGGFEPAEAELIAKSGFITATLGARILRCETAPVAAAAILMSLTGNME